MAVTAAKLETAIMTTLRTTLSAVATTVMFGSSSGTVYNALIAMPTRRDETNTAGVDDAHSGTVYVGASTCPAIPDNRRLYVLSGGSYVARRIVRVTTRAGAVCAIEFESIQRGAA